MQYTLLITCVPVGTRKIIFSNANINTKMSSTTKTTAKRASSSTTTNAGAKRKRQPVEEEEDHDDQEQEQEKPKPKPKSKPPKVQKEDAGDDAEEKPKKTVSRKKKVSKEVADDVASEGGEEKAKKRRKPISANELKKAVSLLKDNLSLLEDLPRAQMTVEIFVAEQLMHQNSGVASDDKREPKKRKAIVMTPELEEKMFAHWRNDEHKSFWATLKKESDVEGSSPVFTAYNTFPDRGVEIFMQVAKEQGLKHFSFVKSQKEALTEFCKGKKDASDKDLTAESLGPRLVQLYPPPPIVEFWAGCVRFNADEKWKKFQFPVIESSKKKASVSDVAAGGNDNSSDSKSSKTASKKTSGGDDDKDVKADDKPSKKAENTKSDDKPPKKAEAPVDDKKKAPVKKEAEEEDDDR